MKNSNSVQNNIHILRILPNTLPVHRGGALRLGDLEAKVPQLKHHENTQT